MKWIYYRGYLAETANSIHVEIVAIPCHELGRETYAVLLSLDSKTLWPSGRASDYGERQDDRRKERDDSSFHD
jgi:hypothetical protein